MYKRFYYFFEGHELLFKSQYGFRKNHSTIQAVLEFINDAVDIENRQSTLGVFLDLSKAFDTIDHNILLQKMEFYGIRGIAHAWIKSYLSNRTQFVQYKNSSSNTMNVHCGIPQGSILGPLLFIIYINDLPDCLLESHGILFADVTTVYQSSKNIKSLYTSMNADLGRLADWFQSNKLSLNVNKSTCMLISNSHEPHTAHQVLKLENNIIEPKQCVKFLGLYLDNRLSWHEHISVCKSKICSSTYAINRIKNFVPKPYMRTLYFTLIYPYLTYGLPLWGSTFNVHKKKIITVQKKIIRIISNAKYNDHTEPLFKKACILKLDDLYNVEILKIIYKHAHNQLPEPIAKMFILNSEVHERNTRQHADFHIKKCRTTLATQHIASKGPLIWNALPVNIKHTQFSSLKAFVNIIVQTTLNNYS